MSGYAGYAYDNPGSGGSTAAGAGSGLGILDGGGNTGTPRNSLLPSITNHGKGGAMPSEKTLRNLAFYLALGAATAFLVSHLSAIK